MSIVYGLRILLLIGICIVVSVVDIKTGKIYNKTLLVGFILGTICNIFIFVFQKDFHFVNYLINSLFLVFCSLVLYRFNIWAGGDTKLLILIAYLFPSNFYFYINDKNFSSWLMVVFMFSFGYVYIIIDTFRLLIKKRNFSIDKISRKLKLFLKRYIISIIYISAISHVYIYFIYPIIKIESVLYTAICIAIIYLLNKIELFENKILIVFVIIFDVLMTLFTGVIPLNTNIVNYLIVLFLMLVQILATEFNYLEIQISELKENMILSQQYSILFIKSKVKNLPNISDETLKSRLTTEEIDSVKRWAKSKNIENVQVVRKIPFAICITLGVILYGILGGIINWL